MVFSNHADRGSLRAFLALVRRQLDANLVADCEIWERASDHCMFVEVDLDAVAGLDEAVTVLREQANHAPVTSNVMHFGSVICAPFGVLELAFGGPECVSDGHIDILVCVIVGSFVIDRDLTARRTKLNPDLVQLAFVLVLVWRFDDHVTTRDAIGKALQTLRTFANSCFNGG